jgi:hypothetical protein
MLTKDARCGWYNNNNNIIIIIISSSSSSSSSSSIGHSTHTAESANVEAQRPLIVKTVLYAPLTVRAA